MGTGSFDPETGTRMRIISQKRLREYWLRNQTAERDLRAWYKEASIAAWANVNDVRATFPQASIVPIGTDIRVVFRFGHRYRLITVIHFNEHPSAGRVYIRWVGTHEQYNNIHSRTIQAGRHQPAWPDITLTEDPPMLIKPIRTEADYDAAIIEIDRLVDAQPTANSAERDTLEVLSDLVWLYDETHHPIAPPSPIDALHFAMEQRSYTRKDLEQLLGVSRGRVSELLNGKRGLSLAMIRTLHAHWGLPLESLVAVELAA